MKRGLGAGSFLSLFLASSLLAGGCSVGNLDLSGLKSDLKADIRADVRADVKADVKSSDLATIGQSTSQSNVLPATSSALTKDDLRDLLASASLNASPTVVVATTTIIVQPATVSPTPRPIKEAWHGIVEEMTGEGDGLVTTGNERADVVDLKYDYVRSRMAFCIRNLQADAYQGTLFASGVTGSKPGIMEWDESAQAYSPLMAVASGSDYAEVSGSALFRLINQTSLAGPLSAVDEVNRKFRFAAEFASSSIPVEVSAPPGWSWQGVSLDELNDKVALGQKGMLYGYPEPQSFLRFDVGGYARSTMRALLNEDFGMTAYDWAHGRFYVGSKGSQAGQKIKVIRVKDTNMPYGS